MPKFTYEDTQTGKTLTLDRETEPSESELNQLFAVQQPAAQQPAARPNLQRFLTRPCNFWVILRLKPQFLLLV